MMHEYYEWCKEHPDATADEKKAKWEELCELLQVRAAIIYAFSCLR